MKYAVNRIKGKNMGPGQHKDQKMGPISSYNPKSRPFFIVIDSLKYWAVSNMLRQHAIIEF